MDASEEHFAPIIVVGLLRDSRIPVIGLRGVAWRKQKPQCSRSCYFLRGNGNYFSRLAVSLA